MTENKLYAQCREEAIEQLKITIIIDYWNYADYVSQLTAEIYGMKLLDMAKDLDLIFSSLYQVWEYCALEEIIGTTQDLHDMFVREFNKEVGK